MNLIYDIKLNLLKISVFKLSLIFVTNSVMASGIDSLFRSDENPEYHDAELIYYSPNGEPAKLAKA